MIGKILEAIDNDPSLDDGQRLELKEQIRNSREEGLDANQQASLWKKVKEGVPQRIWDFTVPILQAILTAEAKKRLGLPP